MEKSKIQAFTSGWLEIWKKGGKEPDERLYPRIRYDTRTVGSKRAFEAEQAGHLIAKMVRIPVVPVDFNNLFVRLEGKHRYDIVQVQEIQDTAPRCLQLSLEMPNISWAQQRGRG